MRQWAPTIAHLERSGHGIVPKPSNGNVGHSLARLIASDQVQRQPALNAGCSVVEAMVPSQGMNAIGSRVLAADHSLVG